VGADDGAAGGGVEPDQPRRRVIACKHQHSHPTAKRLNELVNCKKKKKLTSDPPAHS
jgi:hypothetical protein